MTIKSSDIKEIINTRKDLLKTTRMFVSTEEQPILDYSSQKFYTLNKEGTISKKKPNPEVSRERFIKGVKKLRSYLRFQL